MTLANWNSIPAEALNPQMTRKAIHTERLTIAHLRIAAGGSVPMHSHENEQITYVVEGLLVFHSPEGEIRVGAGGVLVIPPNVPHAVDALEDSLAIDSFAPRRQDWIDGDDAYLRGSSAVTPPAETK
jgi:quercetin dioxygenase-like cupin family protein